MLAGIRPVGERHIEEFEAAGGACALMKQLAPLLDTSAMTVTGCTVADNLHSTAVINDDVIRPIDNPVAPRPAIVLLRGNLAPEPALIKTGITKRKVRRFSGPSICFEPRMPHWLR